jgi:uncharacterized lipoprotein YmbA
MNPRFSLRLLLLLVASASLAGCSFLKPTHTVVRHFVLTPLPPVVSGSVPANAPSLGIGQVKIPAYLFNTSLAVRRGTNEVDYQPLALWAERLDTSLQRVLAANLAAVVPTDRIRLSAWRSEDVTCEVYVALESFDVDASGKATLSAWWRVLAPGGETTLKAGRAQLTRQGPPPVSDPAGAVATLSELLVELSRELAQAVR